MLYKFEIVIERIKNFISGHSVGLLFFIFLFIYFAFGLYITYFNKNIIWFRADLLYDLDSGKTYAWYFINQGFPTIKHLLSYLILSPAISIVKGFTNNPKLAVLLIQSLAQSFAVCLIYKILYKLSDNKLISLMFGILFGFSYTVLLFAVLPEIYVWVALIQILLLYYVVSLIKNRTNKLNFQNIFVLSVLTTFSYGINIVNIASCTCLILFLLIKIYGKENISVIKDYIKITITTFILIVTFLAVQSFGFNCYKYIMGDSHIDYHIKTEKVFNMVKGSLVSPFYALSASKTKDYYKLKTGFDQKRRKTKKFVEQENQPSVIYFPILLFLLIPLLFYLKNCERYSNRYLINTLSGIVCIYTIFNLFFNNKYCSLSALNYFPFLIVVLGLIYDKMPAKLKYAAVILFLSWLIPENIYYLFKIQNFVHTPREKFYPMGHCALYSSIFVLLLGILKCCLNKILKGLAVFTDENKYFICTSAYSVLMIIYALINAFSIYGDKL